jgi:hypothetical protein
MGMILAGDSWRRGATDSTTDLPPLVTVVSIISIPSILSIIYIFIIAIFIIAISILSIIYIIYIIAISIFIIAISFLSIISIISLSECGVWVGQRTTTRNSGNCTAGYSCSQKYTYAHEIQSATVSTRARTSPQPALNPFVKQQSPLPLRRSRRGRVVG